MSNPNRRRVLCRAHKIAQTIANDKQMGYSCILWWAFNCGDSAAVFCSLRRFCTPRAQRALLLPRFKWPPCTTHEQAPQQGRSWSPRTALSTRACRMPPLLLMPLPVRPFCSWLLIPQPIQVSQRGKGRLVHRCAPTPLTPCDAPVSCACCSVDAPLVCVGSVARADSAGYPACEEYSSPD